MKVVTPVSASRAGPSGAGAERNSAPKSMICRKKAYADDTHCAAVNKWHARITVRHTGAKGCRHSYGKMTLSGLSLRACLARMNPNPTSSWFALQCWRSCIMI